MSRKAFEKIKAGLEEALEIACSPSAADRDRAVLIELRRVVEAAAQGMGMKVIYDDAAIGVWMLALEFEGRRLVVSFKGLDTLEEHAKRMEP